MCQKWFCNTGNHVHLIYRKDTYHNTRLGNGADGAVYKCVARETEARTQTQPQTPKSQASIVPSPHEAFAAPPQQTQFAVKIVPVRTA